jgi:hypothetical protein
MEKSGRTIAIGDIHGCSRAFDLLLAALFKFGLHQGTAIANLTNYEKYKYLDGCSGYKWRSGVKHDAAKIMELSLKNDRLINGFDFIELT